MPTLPMDMVTIATHMGSLATTVTTTLARGLLLLMLRLIPTTSTTTTMVTPTQTPILPMAIPTTATHMPSLDITATTTTLVKGPLMPRQRQHLMLMLMLRQ